MRRIHARRRNARALRAFVGLRPAQVLRKNLKIERTSALPFLPGDVLKNAPRGLRESPLNRRQVQARDAGLNRLKAGEARTSTSPTSTSPTSASPPPLGLIGWRATDRMSGVGKTVFCRLPSIREAPPEQVPPLGVRTIGAIARERCLRSPAITGAMLMSPALENVLIKTLSARLRVRSPGQKMSEIQQDVSRQTVTFKGPNKCLPTRRRGPAPI